MRLPAAIRDRKKKGFSAPVKQWYPPEALGRLVQQVRQEKPDLSKEWFGKGLDSFASHTRGSRGYKLWAFLQWLRRID